MKGYYIFVLLNLLHIRLDLILYIWDIKVHFLLDNISQYSYDKDTNIFIGTPYEIENEFYRLRNNFDYVVFDEIHNLNKEDDGDIYENLIKLIDCNFLALSATIKNIDFLKEIFQKNFKKS